MEESSPRNFCASISFSHFHLHRHLPPFFSPLNTLSISLYLHLNPRHLIPNSHPGIPCMITKLNLSSLILQKSYFDLNHRSSILLRVNPLTNNTTNMTHIHTRKLLRTHTHIHTHTHTSVYIYIYIHTHTHTHTCVYIYIYRERDRETERDGIFPMRISFK